MRSILWPLLNAVLIEIAITFALPISGSDGCEIVSKEREIRNTLFDRIQDRSLPIGEIGFHLFEGNGKIRLKPFGRRLIVRFLQIELQNRVELVSFLESGRQGPSPPNKAIEEYHLLQ
ncbi:hypothetical protein C491_06038 [Natronococcus amylolyticus DSM 10524]|uniref:Uncharacterized protein n=1 Tax=Natronococcus amylolyticus DSM 10524 TaxID=1227497 RepID=L9XD14_9EURY|nr:hypothetical protein C491_06038 [Natronococcus amylolyticus DSM 10524]